MYGCMTDLQLSTAKGKRGMLLSFKASSVRRHTVSHHPILKAKKSKAHLLMNRDTVFGWLFRVGL